MTDQNLLRLYHSQAIHLWENLCELHKDLYDLTCEEYLTLLASDIEKLEVSLTVKEEIIKKVTELDHVRSDLIQKINSQLPDDKKIIKAVQLIDFFATIERENGIRALENLNSFLIDVITKIQDQNKKNQYYLNKAMASLQEIKSGFNGKKNYTTYGSNGLTRQVQR